MAICHSSIESDAVAEFQVVIRRTTDMRKNALLIWTLILCAAGAVHSAERATTRHISVNVGKIVWPYVEVSFEQLLALHHGFGVLGGLGGRWGQGFHVRTLQLMYTYSSRGGSEGCQLIGRSGIECTDGAKFALLAAGAGYSWVFKGKITVGLAVVLGPEFSLPLTYAPEFYGVPMVRIGFLF